MFALTDILDNQPFSLGSKDKAELYLQALSDLTMHHYAKCVEYKRLLDILGFVPDHVKNVEGIPFVPVRLFKEYDLLSVDRSQVIKTMTSSGTTGQSVSKIFLDKDTSTNQTKVLSKIVSSFIGKKRLPMLIIDSKAVIKDRNLFSARGAGILGFSMLGYDVMYALNDQMQVDVRTGTSFYRKAQRRANSAFWFYFYDLGTFLYCPEDCRNQAGTG